MQLHFRVDERSQIAEVRRNAQAMARALDFDDTDAGRVSLAATELATNLVNHARGGQLLMQPIARGEQWLVELLAIDAGGGMDNVERCLADGYSTGGTSGTGLGAVKRLSREFDIYSVLGEGTVVMARIGASSAAAEPRGEPRFGAISVAMHGEGECGDCWRLAGRDGKVSVLVVDGLGHGPQAAQASQAVAEPFGKAGIEAPAALLEKAHSSAAKSRGAAAAAATIHADGKISYAGIGNIAGHLVSAGRSQGLVSHSGMLGVQYRKIQQFEYERDAETLLVMHSDGISARWNLKEQPDLMARHPAVIAGVIYRDHGRQRDDATIVVVA